MVDDLARSVPDTEPAVDKDFRDPIDDDDEDGDGREEDVAAKPAQRPATLTTLTVRSFPSICSRSVDAPSGAAPRATATASVSVAM